MEVELHIPTESFGFVAIKCDANATTAAALYREYAQAFKPKEGIPYEEFRTFLDQQLMGVPNHADTFAKLSEWQNGVVQEIKKSLARVKARQSKQQ